MPLIRNRFLMDFPEQSEKFPDQSGKFPNQSGNFQTSQEISKLYFYSKTKALLLQM